MISLPWRVAVIALGVGACAKGIPVPAPTATVKVPAGTFVLGGGPATCPTQSGSCGSTTGTRPVQLSQPFEIEAHEVTVRQYQACVELGHCCGDAMNNDYVDQGDLPAEVRIDQARQYCQVHGRRLPTEAEWEVAARVKDAAGAIQTYPWGSSALPCGQIPSQECNPNDDGRAPVASNPADKTPLGIFDMAGSVAEWVEDDFTLGVGCRFQVPLASYCEGNPACMASICSSSADCQTECQGTGMSNGCGTDTLPSGGAACPTIPAAEVMVDPLIVTYDHAASTQGRDCQYGGDNQNSAPMSKGGGVAEPSCAQNPAMRTSQRGYGPSGAGDGSRQLGFRCVVRASAAVPRATGTARLQLPGSPSCGVMRIAPVTPAAPPPGWGTQTRVALATQLGLAAGKYDAASKKYSIDLNDKLAFPATPCPASGYVSMFSGNTMLVLSAVPVTAFDVHIEYPSQSGSSCLLSYDQTVNLLANPTSCGGMAPPNGVYCP